MSGVTILLSMAAATSLTLAGVHLLTWFRLRRSSAEVLFALAAISAAATAMLELAAMHASTPAELGTLIQREHVAVYVLVVALAWFVPLHLRAGLPWLAGLITALRTLVLVANFASPPNATFSEITGLQTVTFLGEQLTTPVGSPSAWRVVSQATAALLLIHVGIASVSAWRKRRERRSLVFGGLVAAGILLPSSLAELLARGSVPSAFISLGFSLIVVAMAYELSLDLVRGSTLDRELHESKERLIHAQRVASIESFSAAFAHEITQPLGAILRNAEAATMMLEQNQPDLEELRAIFSDIRRDDDRATQILARMREFLKRQALKLEPIDVNDFARSLEELLGVLLRRHGARLRLDVPSDLPRVIGDQFHLQQVFVNLAMNSLEALEGRPNGEREILLRAARREPAMVEVSVMDRGRGIPVELMPRLFESFATSKKDGIGMGLAISRAIVQLHAGEITGRNNADGGATFSVTLKAVEGRAR